MGRVTVRDLRNNSAEVLARVAHGESLTVTKDGEPVASLAPLPKTALGRAQLIERRKSLPKVDSEQLWADIDDLLDPSL